MRRQDGFSLLETLIALAVVALFFGVLLPPIMTNLERIEADALRAEALLVAANQLEAHTVIAADAEGRFEGSEGALTWRATVEQAGTAARAVDTVKPYALRRVQVDVFAQGRVPLVSLETYRIGVVR